jgi:hypothetical protein
MNTHEHLMAPQTGALTSPVRTLEGGRSAEASAAAQWSNWSRCESSFSLLLVPHRAGVFVLAEEIAAVGSDARMLAVFHVAEADDLARSVSRVFASGSELREKLLTTPCFLRYAAMDDAAQRQTIAMALNRWIAEAQAAAAQIRPQATNSAELRSARSAEAAEPTRTASAPTKPDIIVDSDPGDEQPRVFDAAWGPDPAGNAKAQMDSVVKSLAQRTSVGDRRTQTRWRGPFPAGF